MNDTVYVVDIRLINNCFRLLQACLRSSHFENGGAQFVNNRRKSEDNIIKQIQDIRKIHICHLEGSIEKRYTRHNGDVAAGGWN